MVYTRTMEDLKQEVEARLTSMDGSMEALKTRFTSVDENVDALRQELRNLARTMETLGRPAVESEGATPDPQRQLQRAEVVTDLTKVGVSINNTPTVHDTSKWASFALTKFKGKQDEVTWDQFQGQFQRICLLHNVPEEKKAALLGIYLQGLALGCYEEITKAKPEIGFAVLCEELKVRLTTSSGAVRAALELSGQKQGKSETVAEYYARYRTVVAQGKAQLTDPFVMLHFWLGLRQSIATKLMHMSERPLDEVVQAAIGVESSLKAMGEDQQETVVATVNPLVQIQDSKGQPRGSRQTLTCFNCHKPGHLSKDCRSKRSGRTWPNKVNPVQKPQQPPQTQQNSYLSPESFRQYMFSHMPPLPREPETQTRGGVSHPSYANEVGCIGTMANTENCKGFDVAYIEEVFDVNIRKQPKIHLL